MLYAIPTLDEPHANPMGADSTRVRVRNTFVELLLSTPTETPREGAPATTPAAFAPPCLSPILVSPVVRRSKPDPLKFNSHSSMVSIPELPMEEEDSPMNMMAKSGQTSCVPTPHCDQDNNRFSLKLSDFISTPTDVAIPSLGANVPQFNSTYYAQTTGYQAVKYTSPAKRYYEMLGERRRSIQREEELRIAAEREHGQYDDAEGGLRLTPDKVQCAAPSVPAPLLSPQCVPCDPPLTAPILTPEYTDDCGGIAPPPAQAPKSELDDSKKDDARALLHAAVLSKNPRAIKAMINIAQEAGFSESEFCDMVNNASNFCRKQAALQTRPMNPYLESDGSTDISTTTSQSLVPEAVEKRKRRSRKSERLKEKYYKESRSSEKWVHAKKTAAEVYMAPHNRRTEAEAEPYRGRGKTWAAKHTALVWAVKKT